MGMEDDTVEGANDRQSLAMIDRVPYTYPI